jgi:hypothetical protein
MKLRVNGVPPSPFNKLRATDGQSPPTLKATDGRGNSIYLKICIDIRWILIRFAHDIH